MLLMLPTFLRGLLEENPRQQPDRQLDIAASSVDELRTLLAQTHPRIADRCWAADGSLRRDVVLVVNDELVPRSSYDRIELGPHDHVNVLMQFAGG